MNLNIQFLSDTHTECIAVDLYLKHKEFNTLDTLWADFVTVKGDIVVLCGDIGNPHLESYWLFLEYISLRCKKLLVVSGNHEYWGSSIEETELLIKSKISFIKNAKYLQRDFFIIDKTVFLGCTMWSYMPPQFSKQLEGWAGDFKFIKDCKDVSVYNSWHIRDVKWLLSAVKHFRKEDFEVIILTHHTPKFELNFNPKFPISWEIFNFTTDLEILFPYIKLWVYGHTHFDYSKSHIYTFPEIPNTLFASNQRGYPNSVRYKYSQCALWNMINITPTVADCKSLPEDVQYENTYVNKIEDKIAKWLKKS
jgi:predicted phosphohydrolase